MGSVGTMTIMCYSDDSLNAQTHTITGTYNPKDVSSFPGMCDRDTCAKVSSCFPCQADLNYVLSNLNV